MRQDHLFDCSVDPEEWISAPVDLMDHITGCRIYDTSLTEEQVHKLHVKAMREYFLEQEKKIQGLGSGWINGEKM